MLENKDVEDVATSAEPQNGNVPPQPQLEQANQSLVAQSGAQEYAPHVINTPLAFLIKSALNSNIFGEPGWMGTGWRAGRDLQRHDIGGKTGTTNSSKDAWFSGYGPGVVTSVWIGFDDHRRDLGRTTASGAIKDQISGYEGGAKSAQPASGQLYEERAGRRSGRTVNSAAGYRHGEYRPQHRSVGEWGQ